MIKDYIDLYIKPLGGHLVKRGSRVVSSSFLIMSLHNGSWGLVRALLGYNYLEFVISTSSFFATQAGGGAPRSCQIVNSIIEIGSDIFGCLGCYALYNAWRSGAG